MTVFVLILLLNAQGMITNWKDVGVVNDVTECQAVAAQFIMENPVPATLEPRIICVDMGEFTKKSIESGPSETQTLSIGVTGGGTSSK